MDKQDCTNCRHCRLRHCMAYCKLDQEVKPAMSYTCNRWEQGAQWELLGVDGTVLKIRSSIDCHNGR